MAFNAWLKLKEEQKIREEKQKKKTDKNEENSVSLQSELFNVLKQRKKL